MSKNRNGKICTLTPQVAENESIRQLDRLFSEGTTHPKLVDDSGREIPLPGEIYQAFQQIFRAMAEGKTITIAPSEREISTQEAADLLNVSRPHLIKLLDQGAIPYRLVGAHRRVKYQDLMKYKESKDQLRDAALSKIADLLQDENWDDYDEE